jgi:DnaJ-domain-containing protein 1
VNWRNDNLASKTFEDFVNATPLALVALDDERFSIPVSEEMLRSYRARYPFDFGFGRMALTNAARRHLATQHVRHTTHAEGYEIHRAVVGLYLFVEGIAAAHHTGFDPDTLSFQIRAGLRIDDRLFVHFHAMATHKAFDNLLANFGEARRARTTPHTAPPPTPRPPLRSVAKKQVNVDPFVTLGVGPDAPDDVLRKAHKARIFENHPDRVHGMDKAFVELALRRTRAINAAWERVRKARGI